MKNREKNIEAAQELIDIMEELTFDYRISKAKACRLLGLSYSTYFSVINGEYRLSDEKMESVRERYEEVQADTIAGVDPCERLYGNADY